MYCKLGSIKGISGMVNTWSESQRLLKLDSFFFMVYTD
jgi:hypothetical protein